jgi:hypothetical protein
MTINPFPCPATPGQQVSTGIHQVITLLYPKSGATRGQTTSTFTGTPTHQTLYNYSLSYVKANDATPVISNVQSGMFFYTRSSTAASLADFLLKLAAHLNRYHDVDIVTVTATTLVVRSRWFGQTASLTMNQNGVVATVTATTAALPARPIMPGLFVAINETPISGYMERTAKFPDANSLQYEMGITLLDHVPTRMAPEDQVLNVLVSGSVWVRLAGNAPLVPATSNVQIGRGSSNNPGAMGVAGLDVPLAADAMTTSLGMTWKIHEANAQVGDMVRFTIRN